MEQNIFRKKSMERVSSPEQLEDYLRITSPSVWILLAAVVILLAGFFYWGITTTVYTSAEGAAEVKNGSVVITFKDETLAKNVKPGMNAVIGDFVTPVLSVGQNGKGKIFAVANLNIPDGRYDAHVGYKAVQLIDIVFN